MHRSRFADNLVQLAAVPARAVGDYLVERAAVHVTNGELAACRALDTSAAESEGGRAPRAPEDLERHIVFANRTALDDALTRSDYW
jgi:hypothetical protein